MPESLLALALLACPVGMGAMMWMMSRGSKPPSEGDVGAKQAQLTELQTQIDQLRDERGSAQADAERRSVT